MERRIRDVTHGLAFFLCVATLAGAGTAAATGETREVTTYEKTSGNTTYKNTETQENVGTAEKPDWKKVESRELTETRREGESHVVDREIKIRRYDPGERRPKETEIVNEVEQPVFKLEPTVKSRTTKKTRYEKVDGKRKKTETVEESWEVVEVDDYGVPIAKGSRKTTQHGPKGDTTTEEILDPKTGQWKPAPKTAGSSSKKAARKKATAKKAAKKKAPTNAQHQGLPTNNPGQRGMIPDVPNVPNTPSYPKGPTTVPKGKY